MVKAAIAAAGVAAPHAAASVPARFDEEAFAHDIGLMLRSGLSLLESLRALCEQDDTRRSAFVHALLDALQQGHPLSAALQRCAAPSLPLVACVRASELTGDLGPSLERFAANAARLRTLRGRLVSACVYPTLLVSVSTVVVLFLLVYVIPRFATVLEGSHQQLSLMSRLLIATGTTLHTFQWPIWLALAGGLLALGALAWRRARAGELASWLLQQAGRLPWMRSHVRGFGLGQLSRSAAMLVRSGIPAIRALAMCRDLLAADDRPRLDAALAAASTGEPLARALLDSGLVDALGGRILRVSQESGQLDIALDRLADVHDARLERGLDRLGRLVEPVLMLTIGTVVGGIVVLMYVPIFQLASSIG